MVKLWREEEQRIHGKIVTGSQEDIGLKGVLEELVNDTLGKHVGGLSSQDFEGVIHEVIMILAVF